MRATLIFLVAAFDADLEIEGAPTFDPEELDISLLDEYMASDTDADARSLQFMVNATNITAPAASSEVPFVPLALVGLAGAAAAGYFMTRPGASYETYEYEEEPGLLDEEYGEYEEEYEEYEEEYEEYE